MPHAKNNSFSTLSIRKIKASDWRKSMFSRIYENSQRVLQAYSYLLIDWLDLNVKVKALSEKLRIHLHPADAPRGRIISGTASTASCPWSAGSGSRPGRHFLRCWTRKSRRPTPWSRRCCRRCSADCLCPRKVTRWRRHSRSSACRWSCAGVSSWDSARATWTWSRKSPWSRRTPHFRLGSRAASAFAAAAAAESRRWHGAWASGPQRWPFSWRMGWGGKAGPPSLVIQMLIWGKTCVTREEKLAPRLKRRFTGLLLGLCHEKKNYPGQGRRKKNNTEKFRVRGARKKLALQNSKHTVAFAVEFVRRRGLIHTVAWCGAIVVRHSNRNQVSGCDLKRWQNSVSTLSFEFGTDAVPVSAVLGKSDVG